jgi:hypothetical protein
MWKAIAVLSVYLLLPEQAQAERNWEFSVGAFGGKAYHANQDILINQTNLIGGGNGSDVTVHGVN